MSDINQSNWSATDASNNSAITLPGWPEGMSPSIVNDAARALQGGIKRWYQRINPTLTSTGSGNAQVLTYSVAPSFATGDVFTFTAGFSNTGDTTLTVNGTSLGHVTFQGANLVGGEIVAGTIIMVAYDGTNSQLIARSGGLVNPHFTAGSVTFAGASGQLAQDNANFFWDSTNHNLGVGGAAAANWRVGVVGHGTTSATFGLVVDNSVGGGLLWARDDGVIAFPQYGNGALSVSGGAVISGVLTAGLGGTGVTSSTGTGSVVLNGSPAFTGTIGAAGWNITQAGSCIFNGNLNVGGVYEIAGTTVLQTNGNYTELVDSTGAAQILLGNLGDQNHYYRNTGHIFETRSGGAILASINSAGVVNAVGGFTTAAVGNLLGSPGGSISVPSRTNTNVLLYNNSATNWSGIGSDTGGSMYFVTGVVSPATRMVINAAGNLVYTAAATGIAVATSTISSNVSLAVQDPGSGFSGGAGGLNLLTNNAQRISITDALINLNTGTTNVAGVLQLGGTAFAQRITSGPNGYHYLFDYNGNGALLLGGAGDQSNYYRNTTHFFQSINGGAGYATINSTGLSVAGAIAATSTVSTTAGFSQSSSTFTMGGGTVAYNGVNNFGIVNALSASYCVARNDGACELGDVAVGQSAVYSGGGAFSFTSDRKLKENIRPYTETSFLSMINKLQPMRFNMIADEKKRDQIGFIAQDVQEIFPDLVDEQPDGNLSLAYGGLIMPLIAAVQELTAENKSLKADLAAIKAKLGI